MKTNFLILLCAICTSIFITGCQKDDLARPLGGDSIITPRSHDCSLVCIDEDSGNQFSHTQSVTVSYGGSCQCNNTKTLSVEVWNTLTTIEYRFLLTTNAMSAGNLQYFDEGTNTWLSEGAFTNNVIKSVSRPLPSGWNACDLAVEQWRQVGGGPDAMLGAVSYALVGPCGCDESFSYTDNGDETWTFSYTPEEDFEDAHLVFTFAQGVVLTGLDGWSVHGVTRQNTQDLVACTTYTWAVGLACADNPGAHNLWTDFKVNDVSKKNDDTPNIVADCD